MILMVINTSLKRYSQIKVVTEIEKEDCKKDGLSF